MVRGLDLFREHFAAFKDRYVLIGGTASFLVLKPDTSAAGYAPIVIEGEGLEGLAIVAELVKILR